MPTPKFTVTSAQCPSPYSVMPSRWNATISAVNTGLDLVPNVSVYLLTTVFCFLSLTVSFSWKYNVKYFFRAGRW